MVTTDLRLREPDAPSKSRRNLKRILMLPSSLVNTFEAMTDDEREDAMRRGATAMAINFDRYEMDLYDWRQRWRTIDGSGPKSTRVSIRISREVASQVDAVTDSVNLIECWTAGLVFCTGLLIAGFELPEPIPMCSHRSEGQRDFRR